VPHPVDIHVGGEIARRRALQGANQSELGRALGLTFQQIQKYEKGTNRVSASKLYLMADFFGCDPGDFFPKRDGSSGPASTPGFYSIRGAPVLAKAYEALPPNRRTLLLALAAELVPDEAPGEPAHQAAPEPEAATA
jgi:transcriptional regulator with XRE-family HTH domain